MLKFYIVFFCLMVSTLNCLADSIPKEGAICKSFRKAKDTCAIAGDYSQCLVIKIEDIVKEELPEMKTKLNIQSAKILVDNFIEEKCEPLRKQNAYTWCLVSLPQTSENMKLCKDKYLRK